MEGILAIVKEEGISIVLQLEHIDQDEWPAALVDLVPPELRDELTTTKGDGVTVHAYVSAPGTAALPTREGRVETNGRGAPPDSARAYFVDASRRRRGCDVDIPLVNRGGAAATTWIVRGDGSRRRRGDNVDSPWRRVTAAPRRQRG